MSLPQQPGGAPTQLPPEPVEVEEEEEEKKEGKGGGGGQNGACEAPVSGIVAASGILGVQPTTLLLLLYYCFPAAFLLLY